MKSLRLRMFVSITGVILFFVCLSALLNTFFLDKYYLAQKENSLQSISKEIDRRYTGTPSKISSYLKTLERTSNLRVVILNSQLKLKYDTVADPFKQIAVTPPHRNLLFPEPKNTDSREPPPSSLDVNRHSLAEAMIIPNTTSLQKGQTAVVVTRDPGLQHNFLNLVTRLHNGDYLALSTPLAAIKESSDIANHFFLFTGLLTILFGLVAAYLLSERFTKPIRELNQIAMEMSKLQFDTRCTVSSQDEIGQLGSSINSLSEQLDHAINELRHANQKLQQDVERERKIDQMRKEFISNVSHEMKTPIALIAGYAEGLKLNVIQDERTKNEYCDVITDETVKMNKLITSLLELSKLESGYFTLNRACFDINLLISQQLFKLKPLLEQQGVDLQWEPGGCLEVDADEFYIEQVFNNYINNASRHVNSGGIIRVTTQPLGDKVRVTVWNSGPPIPEDELEKIWTPFYKVDKSHSRAHGGTGLGLSIVKAIQELHGNGYGVNNTPDGVEFWFALDKAQQIPCTLHITYAEPSQTATKIKA